MVELLAVIAVIGIIAALVFPRLTSLEGRSLKSDARRISGLIRYVSESAAIKKLHYRLLFNIEDGVITVASSPDGKEYGEESDHNVRRLRLRRGIGIEDLLIPRTGRVSEGAVTVHFSPYGFSDPFTLHIRGGERVLTLSFNPYKGKVLVTEGYV